MIANLRDDLIRKLQSNTDDVCDKPVFESERLCSELLVIESKNKPELLKMRSSRGSKYRGVSKNGVKW